MEYHGKLYGKVGKSYFPLLKTTQDFNKLESEKQELVDFLQRAYVNNMMSHEADVEYEQLIKKHNDGI